MQNSWNLYLACKQKQLYGPVNYRGFRETGPRQERREKQTYPRATTFRRNRTNFQPAEKFDRTLLSYGIVQYFLLCSHGSLNDLAMKFSPGRLGFVWTKHLIAGIFNRLKINPLLCEGSLSISIRREENAFFLTEALGPVVRRPISA